MNLFEIYFVAINILTFLAYGEDKRRAVHDNWRISEAALIGLALLGGSVGAMAGMRIFHHKTKKPKFCYGVPLIFVAELFLFVVLAR